MEANAISPEKWLEQAGTEYLACVKAQEPQFLVEIEVSDEQLEEIFRRLSKARPTRWSSAQLICLALAAVHSAARAEEGEDSFRQVFYQRLGREFDHLEWETHYGPKSVAFLRDWFSVALLSSGPYRYVGSIYRHAGIPAPARKRFAFLLGHLLKHGPAFSRGLYDEAVEKVSSSALRRFLESSAGYELSQAAALFVSRLERGLVSEEELVSFPSYRRSLYQSVLGLLGPRENYAQNRSSVAFSPPALALDPDTRRLVLKFDPKGVDAKAYRTVTGRPIYYAQEPVTSSVRPEFFVRPETQAIAVTPWWVPGRGPSALFRASDGTIVDSSIEVPPGTYYLATSIPECVPTDLVLEQDSYLENESDSGGSYCSILRVDLPSGCAIPELSIRVRGTARPPVVAFVDDDGFSLQRLGRYVFVDRLPRLRVLNWSSDCDKKYWIWMDDGSGERRLTPLLEEIQVNAPCPCKGRIWIEAKYSGSASPTVQDLSFAVIPSEITIRTVEKTYGANETAQIRATLPPGWQFAPIGDIAAIGPGMWEVPARLRVVDGTLSNRELRIHVSVIVPRSGLWFRAGREGSTIWREEMLPDLPVIVDVRRGSHCYIMLRQRDDSLLTVCDLGFLPESGTRKISLAHFKDTLATCGATSGQFVLKIDTDQMVTTDRYFASAVGIEKSLNTEPLDAIVFRLPSIGAELRQARLLLDGIVAAPLFSSMLDVPDSLRSFLCGLACLAAELDQTPLSEELSSYRRFVAPHVETVLRWLDLARLSMHSLGDEERAIAAFPAEDLAQVPSSRWRESIVALLRQLRLNLNVPVLIAEWRRAVIDPDQERKSELFGRPNGRELTEAARKYSMAFSLEGKSRNEVLTSTIIDLRRVLSGADRDPLINLIASVLLMLACFRSNRLDEASRFSISQIPVSCTRIFTLMRALAARCRNEPMPIVQPGGVGFFDISGQNEDRHLESEVNEPTVRQLSDEIDPRQEPKVE